jgi:membrane protein DedA with SNARE-associated domain
VGVVVTLLGLLAIAGSTLLSEDLTIVAVGLAIHDRALPLIPSLLACAIGIYVGDIGLWAAGRFGGRRVLSSRFLHRLPLGSMERLGAWIDRHPAVAILSSRFMPGTRLPLYVAAGIWGNRPWRFFGWMFVSVAIWSPLIVSATAVFGRAATGPLDRWFHTTWLTRVLLAVAIFAVLRVGLTLASPDGRERLSIRLGRARRWEFWPGWLFNIPIVLWTALLALRYRSLTLFSLANPGIEDGGFVGESKSAILAKLPQARVMPWTVIESGELEQRVQAVRVRMADRGWQFPLVAKPDVGERGTGVRWLHNDADARAYLSREHGRVLLQVPHDGPFEAGLFYIRFPHDARGHLFSITDKRFPIVTGDGHSTLDQLIVAHPRYRLQAAVFRQRHAAALQRVPAQGERVPLARAGNHCQGTQFLDGHSLKTPALEAAVDAIARQIDGFYFGRFDVRYGDRDAFMAGEDFAILELNGVTSEATHIYDPAGSVFTAWRTLMQQWSIAFAIGDANRARGYRPVTVRRLLSLIHAYLRTRPPYAVSA